MHKFIWEADFVFIKSIWDYTLLLHSNHFIFSIEIRNRDDLYC